MRSIEWLCSTVMMLLVTFKDCDLGVPVQFHTDGSVFNLRRLQARTKTLTAVLRELLYADDCALVAHSLDHATVVRSLCCHCSAIRAHGQPQKDGSHVPASQSVSTRTASHQGRRRDHQSCRQVLLPRQRSLLKRRC